MKKFTFIIALAMALTLLAASTAMAQRSKPRLHNQMGFFCSYLADEGPINIYLIYKGRKVHTNGAFSSNSEARAASRLAPGTPVTFDLDEKVVYDEDNEEYFTVRYVSKLKATGSPQPGICR
jgi:hypothetical protein